MTANEKYEKPTSKASDAQAKALLVGRFESPKAKNDRLVKELDEATEEVLAQIDRDRSGTKSGSAASTLQAAQLLKALGRQSDIDHGRSGREDGDE